MCGIIESAWLFLEEILSIVKLHFLLKHNYAVEWISTLTPFNYATICMLRSMQTSVFMDLYEAVCAISLFFLILRATVHCILYYIFLSIADIFISFFKNKRVGEASRCSSHCSSSFCFLTFFSLPLSSLVPVLPSNNSNILPGCFLLCLHCFHSVLLSCSFYCAVVVTTDWFILICNFWWI